MRTSQDTLTATQARAYAARILSECSQCFSNVKPVKRWGRWEIDINGGSAACYGRTVKDEDGSIYTLETFKND